MLNDYKMITISNSLEEFCKKYNVNINIMIIFKQTKIDEQTNKG